MAVVQISRIQIRRGKAQSGTGLPQLASGEMAWALDTQELYIGNGSVAEGAPAVGNTKIITELDLGVNGNILNILRYIYKSSDTGMQTGPTANDPIERGIQERLDDQVNLKNFGVVGDGVADDTVAFQRAIDQLYANTHTTKASEDTFAGIKNRVILNIPAGIYYITDTLLIPSYATLVGEGKDKTFIRYSGTGSVVTFVNDLNSNTQTSGVVLANMTIETDASNSAGIELNSVSNSIFENLIIRGNWGGVGSNTNSKGIWMYVTTALRTCEQNRFNNITIEDFVYAIYAKEDIRANYMNNLYIQSVRQGIILGGDDIIGDRADGSSSSGEQYGPRETYISNVRFYNVKQHAIYVSRGSGNTITDIQLLDVGNNGGGNAFAAFPQIYVYQFNDKSTEGNTIKNVFSDRTYNDSGDLSYPSLQLSTVPYLPEVAGYGKYELFSSKERVVLGTSSLVSLGRLPVNTDVYGNPMGVITYSINYTYVSDGSGGTAYSRRGVFTVVADYDNNTIQYSDDYDYSGSDVTYTEMVTGNVKFVSQALDLQAVWLDSSSNPTTVQNDIRSLGFSYVNPLSGDNGKLTYTYTASF